MMYFKLIVLLIKKLRHNVHRKDLSNIQFLKASNLSMNQSAL